MTEAAELIKFMEAASATGQDPSKLQAQHPTDSIFRRILRATYDPYRQYGLSEAEWGFRRITDPEAIDITLQAEWPAFESVLDDLEEGDQGLRQELSGGNGETVTAGAVWRDSPAWPIYQRVLLKRLQGIKYEDVYKVWMDLPRFMPGKWSEQDPPEYPVYVEPIFPDRRRIVLIRPPRIDVFDTQGTYCRQYFPERYLETLKDFDYKVWLEDSVFHGGIVLDGYQQRDGPFLVFDILPLKRFREQKSTQPYEDRRGVLEALNEIIVPGHDHVRALISTRCDSDAAVFALMQGQARDLERERVRGFVAKNPRLSYPYTPGEAWCRIQLEAEDVAG